MSLSDKKQRLSQQINDIKTDIQYLLDKKKSVKKNTDEYIKIETTRTDKMSILVSLHDELKKVNSEIRKIKQSEYEINKTSRQLDSINYMTAKKKKNDTALIKAKEDKEIRDEARDKYLQYLHKQSEYFERDSDKLPGIIFLHENVISEYGICKYIDIDNVNDTSSITNHTDFLYENRKLWLENQKDGGKIYYDLFDEIYLKKSFDSNLKKKEELEKTIDSWIINNMDELHYSLYNSTIEIIEEYTKSHIKTKKIKEKFKVLINNLSIINSETNINAHDYLSLKYNNTFIVNILKLNKNINIDTSHFNIYIEQYKETLEKISQKEKYITNTIKNLKNELYLYITQQKRFENIEKVQVRQTGKYFKKWKDLIKVEKDERFESFAKYHIEKFMMNKGILSDVDKDKTINQLIELLKQNNNMKYKDFTWKTKFGIIESIKILKFNEETSEFYLTHENKSPKEPGVKSIKKKVSNKTIITKESDEKINEDILYFILKNKIIEKGDEEKLEYKTKLIDKLKIKFKIKKLTTYDKNLITKKYDDILSVINLNQRQENLSIGNI